MVSRLVTFGAAFGLLALAACDETQIMAASTNTVGSANAAAETASQTAIDRARPSSIDTSKYEMVVPVTGDDFPHIVFKSAAHAQDAGYCVDNGWGSVERLELAVDPRSRQSFYFLQCSKEDRSFDGFDDRVAALQAQQAAFDERTAQQQAAADAAVAGAGDYVDPYADCPKGQGGYPIVRDDCAKF